MERPQLTARRARLAGLAVLLVLTTAACSGRNTVIGVAPAATVAGTEITRDQVTALGDAQLAYSKAAVKAGIDAQGQAQGTIDAFASTGTETTGVAGSARALTSLIQRRIYEEAVLAAKEELPTAKALKAAVADIKTQIEGAEVKVTAAFAPLIENEARIKLMSDTLRGTAKISDAERTKQLQDAYQQQVANYTQVCVDLIVSDSEANANAALARVQGGEAWADVAKEASLDPTTAAAGGDAGCVATADLAGIFGQDIYTASPGDIFGPATSQGSWLTIAVTSFDVPTFEDLKAQLDESTPKGDDAAAQAALAKALRGVKVVVDPRFGTWNAKTATVVAPKDPKATSTTTGPTIPATTAPR